MKSFVYYLTSLISLFLVLGGAAFGVFEALTVSTPFLVRVSNPLGMTGAIAIGFMLLVHVALSMSVLPTLPSPGRCKLRDFARALAIGISAMLFLAVGVPTLGANPPANGVLAFLELVSFMYGLVFGGTMTLITLSAMTDQLLNASLEKLEDIAAELDYRLRKKLHSRI